MNRLDLLFLHVPRWSGSRKQLMVMPLGMTALANLLHREGRDVEIVHLGIERELNPAFSLQRLLRDRRPKIVCLSLHWHQQTRAVIEVASRVKSWLPDCFLVIGGLTASTFARDLIEGLPFVDAVVCGDGELPLSRIASCVLDGSGSLNDVPNLVLRQDDGSAKLATAWWALDEAMAARLRHGDLQLLRHASEYLDRALYADYSEGDPSWRGYRRAAYLNAGRGCTASCATCGGACDSQRVTSHRTGLVLYPVDKLVCDVVDAMSQGANTLRMSFDPPSARPHLRRWFEAMQKEQLRPNLVFDCWYLPSRSQLEQFERTFQPGATLILSPECGNERVRYRVRGFPFSNDNLLSSLHAIAAHGMRAHCFFTAGLPTETPDDVEETARLIDRIRSETAAGLSVCPMVLDPSSPIFLEPERWGVRLVRRTLADFYDNKGLADGPGYETSAFSEQQIIDACDSLLRRAGLVSR